MSWYVGEPWVKETTAYKEMQFTRKMHKIIRAKLFQFSKEKIDAACTFANPWCPDRELLLKDFAAACPFEKIGQRPHKLFDELSEKQKHLNAFEMAMTQCSFIGLIVLYPRDFGVHNATDEDLEAFCHMWRCYLYFLGIADEYVLPQTLSCWISHKLNFRITISLFSYQLIIENLLLNGIIKQLLSLPNQSKTRCIIIIQRIIIIFTKLYH